VDHETPLLRLVKSAGGMAVYEILKVPMAKVRVETLEGDARAAHWHRCQTKRTTPG